MKLQDTFQIPADFDRSWTLLQDIPAVASCLPGAQLTAIDGVVCAGKVKVKIGPIVMVYDGELEVVERARGEGLIAMRAAGKDKRGSGTIGADLRLTMTSDPPEETRCTLDVDLDITGKPAQFGRSAIEDVSSRLIRQFATNLSALTDQSEHSEIDASDREPLRQEPARQEAEAFDLLGDSRLKAGVAGMAAAVVALAAIAIGVARRAHIRKAAR